jgi:hypothetical protein
MDSIAKTTTRLVGRLVQSLDDDSDCPPVGVVREVVEYDDNRDPDLLLVMWPLPGSSRRYVPAYNHLDELRPARAGVR